jgi:rhamnosyl/mannosyltransferase
LKNLTPDSRVGATPHVPGDPPHPLARAEPAGPSLAPQRPTVYPWGSSILLLRDAHTSVRRLEVAPGAWVPPTMQGRIGLQWLVVEGRARMTIGGRSFECGTDESRHIPAGMMRSLHNPARTPLVVLEIGAGDELQAAPTLGLAEDLAEPARSTLQRGGAAAHAVPRTRAIRVVHVYKTFLPDSAGAPESTIAQIADSTRRLGVEARVVSVAAPGVLPGVVPYRLTEHHRYAPTLSLGTNAMSLALLRDFGRHLAWADVIHYHFPWPFAELLHLAWRAQKPSVVTCHADIVRPRKLLARYRPLMDRFLDRVDCIVATSPNHLRTSDVLQKYRSKTTVIPIGLEPSSYPATAPETLARWRRSVGANFFLFLGVARDDRSLHILLDALAATPLSTVIVGCGLVEDEMRRHAEHTGLRHVTFLGPLPEEDKAALLELCAAVVLPAHLRSEASGVPLLEGAMFGKPLISSELGTGTSHINIEGETGFVVPPDDPAALGAAMARLAADAPLRVRMGASARRRFDEHFTADRMAKLFVDTYQMLVKRAGPSGARPGNGTDAA